MNRIAQYVAVCFLSIAGCAGVLGCATGIKSTASGGQGLGSGVVSGAALLSGNVHGGSQIITGATVQLWTVGTSGYGSTGSVLATTTTDGTGAFSFAGTTCSPLSELVYVTATGGNPGVANGTNSTISLMTALGRCSGIAGTKIEIDEATTVASVWSLSQFMKANGSVGSFAANTVGITNAFATANSLVDTTVGSALSVTPAGNGVVPQATLNTLANVLASCVNSSGGTAGQSNPCGKLFTAATVGSSVPTNTLQAALNVAQNPGANAGGLFGLVTTTGPFQPTLSKAPTDWTLALSYANSMTDGLSVAIDGSGNVWSVNDQSGSGFVSELSPTGNILTQNFTYHGGDAVAIDLQGNAWVVNASYSQVDEYLPNGDSSAGPFTGNGLSSPKGAAIDGSNNLWITSSGNNTVEELSLSGGAGNYSFTSGNSGYSGAGLSTPVGIAVDESGNAWIANARNVTGLSPTGTAIAGSPYSNGSNSPGGIAVDGTNDIWATNTATNGLLKLTNTAGTVSKASVAPTGVSTAPAVAIDGAENVWIANAGSGGLSEVTPAGVAVNSTGYAAFGMNTPVAMAIDGSGNVWVTQANATQSGALSTAMTEYIGVAVPAITPTSVALQSKQLGTTPGSPIAVKVVSGALPYYTAGQSYQAQLYASGGNSGAFTWSASGLSSGLTISSTGLISGTTTVSGTTSISVTAADASAPTNVATKTLTLTAVGSQTARGNESALTGSYAVLINTFHNNVQSGLVEGTAIMGSVTFNGSGTVSGELDYNDKNSTAGQNATFTGYYTYGSDNRGALFLVVGGNTLQFAFSGGTLSGSTPQSLRLIEFDDTLTQGTNNNGQLGSGVGRLQTSSAFAGSTLNQSFVFGLQGETPCVLVTANGGNGCPNATVSPFGPLSMVGKFTGNGAGGITFGEEDGAGVNTDYNGITMTGSYTNPDGSGRGTLTFSYSGTNVPLAPTHYVYYVVNAGEMLLMSSDGHLSNSLLSGDALVQSGTFTTGTLTGNYLGWETAGYNADGVSNYPTTSGAQLLIATASSAGTLTVVGDQNNAGSLNLEKSQGSPTYTVDSNGRVVGGGGSVIFYLASASRFFGTEQPAMQGGGGSGLLTFQQQSGSGFSCADLNGNFGIGTLSSVIDVSTTSGEGVAASGSAVETLDISSSGVLLQGSPQTSTCSSDSFTSGLGRLMISTDANTQFVAYTIVQGQKYVLMDATGTAVPRLLMLEK